MINWNKTTIHWAKVMNLQEYYEGMEPDEHGNTPHGTGLGLVANGGEFYGWLGDYELIDDDYFDGAHCWSYFSADLVKHLDDDTVLMVSVSW